MKKKMKKVLSSLLILVLLFAWAATPVSAAGAPTTQNKEEVVYVLLGNDGSVSGIYIVNGFEMTEAGRITDRGQYSMVRNLTTTAPIEQEGNLLTVDAPEGWFYYEGQLEGASIPWIFTMEYNLDGKPLTGAELAGKSGKLEMQLHIRQNPAANAVFRDNYALQITLQLSAADCDNIVASDATHANLGEKKQLSYIVFPGKNKDFTVTANVRNFEMDGITLNGIPLAIAIDDPDTGGISEELGSLRDGVVELDDGATTLNNGAGDLYNGIVQVNDGTNALNSGAADMAAGVDRLHEGAQALANGMSDLDSGAVSLQKGLTALKTGADTFAAGVEQLHGQTDTLVTSSAQILGGLQQLQVAVGGFDASGVAAMAQQATELQAGSQAYLDSLDGLIAQTQATLDGIDPDANPEQYAAVATSLGQLQTLRDSYSPINGGVSSMAGAVTGLGGQLPGLADAINTMTASYEAFHTGLVAYTSGVEQLYTSFGQIQTGIADLLDGVGKVQTGTTALAEGASALYAGSGELQTGMAALRSGINELVEGTANLRTGARDLTNGTQTLTEGTAELRDAVEGAYEQMDEKIQELMDEYRSGNFSPVSFVDPANGEIGMVQFVMKTADIKIGDTGSAVADAGIDPATETEVAPVKATVWSRFKDLFA